MSHSQKHARIMLIPLILGILALVVLSGLSASDARKEGLANQTNTPRVVNHTNSLRVSSATIIEGPFQQFKLSVVNQSPRGINGYVLTIGNLSITTDFASIGEVMEPGATRDEFIPLTNFDVAVSHGPRLEREVTIAAVSFAGLTGEGDSRELKMLLDRHQGIKDQVEALLPRLRGMKARSSSPSNEELEEVALKLSSEVDHANNSPIRAEGRRWIFEQFRKQFRESKEGAKIDDLIAFYEQLLSRI